MYIEKNIHHQEITVKSRSGFFFFLFFIELNFIFLIVGCLYVANDLDGMAWMYTKKCIQNKENVVTSNPVFRLNIISRHHLIIIICILYITKLVFHVFFYFFLEKLVEACGWLYYTCTG